MERAVTPLTIGLDGGDGLSERLNNETGLAGLVCRVYLSTVGNESFKSTTKLLL